MSGEARPDGVRGVLVWLTVGAAILFLLAAGQHAGLVPLSFGRGLGPRASLAASIAESVSGALLALGAVGLLGRRAWGLRAALVASIVSILAVLVGITALAGGTGLAVRANTEIHVAMLALLVPGLAAVSVALARQPA